MNPFDIVNAISNKSRLEWNEETEKAYVTFMVNRGLGQFADCVLLANEMNIAPHLDKKLQFDFLYHTVKKGKRFSKWEKASEDATVELLCEFYSYSEQYAKSIVDLFSEEDLNNLKARTQKGGRS